MKSTTLTLTLIATLAAVAGQLTAAEPALESADGVWTLSEPAAPATAPTWTRPQRFRAAALEPAALEAVLALAPKELSAGARGAGAVLSIPTPDGGFERFAVVESPVMQPRLEDWLAAQGWPMKTYSGHSLDTPATALCLDWGGPAGFHAWVRSPGRSYQVEPYRIGDQQYASYFRRDDRADGRAFSCGVGGTDDGHADTGRADAGRAQASRDTGGLLRTYRLAVAATGEYTQASGGTQAAGQAAIVTTIHRVNEVFENEVSLRMILVANNQDLVYTDPDDDPYTNDDGLLLLAENQANVDAEIGPANYDLGHVFNTGAGGRAWLGSSCQNGLKAQGQSGYPFPDGDTFDIAIVAHELAHQWGASHTFNSPLGGCADQRVDDHAFEPGSGSTIMAYAGVCDADDLQGQPDPYFHAESLYDMQIYVAGDGACSTDVAADNPNAPTVDAGADYTIPIATPFELTIAASDDLDGDVLTYTWEQVDLGPAATLEDGDNGESPLFRSTFPTPDSTRTLPWLGEILDGDPMPGETLPQTDRTMTFLVTVRDNALGGGRFESDLMTVTSSTTAGPFAVLSPDGGELWRSGGYHVVTWDVAGTDVGPVATARVDILLSTDGGLTWPHLLQPDTANDGAMVVVLPAVTTDAARIKVRGRDNIFFSVSSADFRIHETTAKCQYPDLPLADGGTVEDLMSITSSESIADLIVELNVSHSWVGDLEIALENLNTGTSVTLVDRPGYPATANGCDGSDIEVILDDEFEALEDQCDSTAPAIDGVFSPAEPLAGFDGTGLDGTWRLIVTDHATPDTGTLDSWCVRALTVPTPLFTDGFESGDTSAWQ